MLTEKTDQTAEPRILSSPACSGTRPISCSYTRRCTMIYDGRDGDITASMSHLQGYLMSR